MDQKLIDHAKEILAKIPYMAIATISPEGQPWNSPVWVAYDKNYNFFWSSSLSAEHSKNIENSPSVFGVVYDQEVVEGVYMQGKAYELNDEKELESALAVFYKRKNRAPATIDNFLGDKPRRIYKFVPEKFWINTYEKKDGFAVDGRIEIKF